MNEYRLKDKVSEQDINTTKSRLIAVGGFLGAGKTELIIQLAKTLTSEHNKRVAIITNDQGEQLVDSKIVKEYGFEYAEVLSGCFCCRFAQFIVHIHEILAEIKPNVILAEPVGSCTDLMSTVYAPLRKYYRNEIILAPYIVLADAFTILDINKKSGILSPKTKQGHLMSWQLREADIIGINKIDLVSSDHIEKVEELLRGINDKSEIITLSAKTGSNVEKITRMILEEEAPFCSSVEVDYDIYGAAEAELGWFNGGWSLKSNLQFEPKNFIQNLLTDIAKRVEKKEGRVCHMKIFLSTEEAAVKASLVTMQQGVQFTGKMPPSTTIAHVTLNIRAALVPEEITKTVNEALSFVCTEFKAEYTEWHLESFRPGFPTPFYKLKIEREGNKE
ncbi:MAG: hypothetical protein ISS45_01110 [Candidatus Omnitrophica bacterium]|nr:hypothetical protein [Candidatus Omnitrophota bacterium]